MQGASREEPARLQASGWAFVVQAQLSPSPFGDYAIIFAAAAPIFDSDVTDVNAYQQGPELSEAYAVHEALKWCQTVQAPVCIHYDSKAAGKSAEGVFTAPNNILAITQASRGLTQIANTASQRVSFEHVYSHEGAPMNELVGDLAKEAARQKCNSHSPFLLSPAWYNPASPVSTWAWLMHISPHDKERKGISPTLETSSTFPTRSSPV